MNRIIYSLSSNKQVELEQMWRYLLICLHLLKKKKLKLKQKQNFNSYLVLSQPTFTLSISTLCKACSKLTMKTPEERHWRRSGIFIVDFEHISHISIHVFLLLTVNMHLLAGFGYVYYKSLSVSN